MKEKSTHIVFLLPEYYEVPMGGYKVVFEYASRLSKDGFNVSLVYPSFLFFRRSRLIRKLKLLFYFLYYLVKKRKGVTWFPLDKQIKSVFVFSLRQKHVPEADYYVATAVETAYYLDNYHDIPPSRKYYFIQAVEDWTWGKETVIKSWQFDMHKVVISSWILSLLQEIGEDATLIENGVDREGLFLKKEQTDRNTFQVMMLYHKQKLKGCDDGLKALEIVRKKMPTLRSVWFGSYQKPAWLPNWIEYTQQPTIEQLNDMYNDSAVYLAPSHNEGFGLTVGEAMTCGCAVVCTDTGGFLTMATHEETALVVPVGNVQKMAEAIVRLIEDESLRHRLASKAHESIARFTWDSAYQSFKCLFVE